MDGDEARESKTMTMNLATSYHHVYRVAATDVDKQVVWIKSRLIDVNYMTIISKVDQDLNTEIVAALDFKTFRNAFTITPDGASLLIAPVDCNLCIYWIDSQNGNIKGGMNDALGNYDSANYLFANTDSSSVYFNNLVGGIQKV